MRIIIAFSILSLGLQPIGGLYAVESLRIKSMTIDVRGTDALISWSTNKPSTACVEFGQGKNYEFTTCANEPNNQNHVIELANLRPETWYRYRIVSEAGIERVESLANTFKTGKRIDNEVPKISNVRVDYVGASIAFITWNTDEPTSSIVEYGIDRVDERRISNSRRLEEHGIKIKGLKENTTYFFRIIATDEAGNQSRIVPMTFKTYFSKDIDNRPPKFLEVSPITSSDPGIRETTAYISWVTSRPAHGSVLYGTDPDKLYKRVSVQVPRKKQSIEITNLTPGKQYYYRILIKDILGKSGAAPSKTATYTFVTKGSSEVFPAKTEKQIPAQRSITKSIKKTKKRLPKVLGAKTENTEIIPASFTPTLPTPSQRLYKPIHGASIYTIINGKRHRISSPESFESYGYKWDDVRIVHPTELEKYPEARLVKERGKPTIYYLYTKTGIKIEIPTNEVFESYPLNKWEDVITISSQDIASYRFARLIRTNNDTETVYYLHNGVARPIAEEETYERYNLNREDIVTINQTHLNSYQIGYPLR